MKLKTTTALMATTLAILTAVSIQANAQGLRLGQPAYGGTGCPAGSASVNLSPDETELSILFDSYVVEAGGTSGRRVDRKSCNVSIPVSVPQGYSVAIFQVDYRGFNLVPRGGMARFDAEYFWAGARGPRQTRMFAGPIQDNYTLSDMLVATTLVWTPCGASVNLRANTSMMVQTNSMNHQAMSTVDSADISSGLIYHVQWRRCM
jgi:hypothetical protein